MRAVTVSSFDGVDAITVGSAPHPTPGPDEVVIDVRAAGVNFPDVLLADGTYQLLPELPFTLGMEAAGVVAEIGENVTGLAIGDRVFAQVPSGAFAEMLLAPRARVYPLPESMTFDEGAAFGLAYLTAYIALHVRGGLVAGETVLVTGVSGGVGAAAAIIAAASGARVIGATRDASAARRVVGEAVAEFVSSDPALLRAEVAAATEGAGPNLVIDVVGGEVLTQALRSSAWEGRVVIVGFASGEQPMIRPGLLLVKNVTVSGLQVTDYLDRRPALVASAIARMAAWHAEGVLAVPVTRREPLSGAAHVLRDMAAGRITGKAVLTVTAPPSTR